MDTERSVIPWKNTVAKEGDLVILWRGHKDSQYVILHHGGRYGHTYGTFFHESLIGKPLGSKVYPDRPSTGDRRGRKRKKGDSNVEEDQKQDAWCGYLVMLSPTPELWSRALKHRTQILFPHDNSMIVHHLHLRPGMKVAESGTGSGSLSTAFARTIAPNGSLHTFEFNESRVHSAKVDFKQLGLDNIISVHHRDSCAKGFMNHGDDDKPFDAVFLDLPKPWLAIVLARKALKPHGRICSFSPCMEQVQRTCITLQSLGFEEIRTFEFLLKEYSIKDIDVPVGSRLVPVEKLEGELKAKHEAKKARAAANAKADSKPPVYLPIQVTDTKNMTIAKPFSDMAGHTGYLTFAYRGME